MRPIRVSLLPFLFLLAACGGGGQPIPAGAEGAPAAQEAVERFLQLAAAKQYLQMGYVFGTEQGSILRRDPAAEVEKRMYALASVLRNDGYSVADQNPVVGTAGQATRFTVQLRNQGRSYQVPFTAVRGPGDRWFVQEVDIDAITSRP